VYVVFFSSRRRHTRFSRDWSSDVCSSDLINLSDRRSWKGISDIAIRYGFTLEDSGAIVVKVQAKDVEKWLQAGLGLLAELAAWRSEERRVGKACRGGGSAGRVNSKGIRWR